MEYINPRRNLPDKFQAKDCHGDLRDCWNGPEGPVTTEDTAGTLGRRFRGRCVSGSYLAYTGCVIFFIVYIANECNIHYFILPGTSILI